ncbi:MAG: bacterial regulatory s, gntR family protein [Gammaproteobacteria bacterium]|nr:bacterial regulatory s, gntR family protein [Gammaproteobacteria bacterium]
MARNSSATQIRSVTRNDGAKGAANVGSPVKIPKAAEIVSRELRNQIVRGTLKEGDSLAAEGELMTRFGVSRPTLREAIRILESEGLISISRGARGGASVLSPNINIAARHIGFVLQANGTTMADIYRVHLVVEPAAAKMVAETARKTAPPILRGCIEECRAKIDDDFAFGIATARFRNTLIELANVPVLTMLMGMLNHIFELAWGMVTATAGQQLDNAPDKRRGLRSMEKLIEYIEAGDGPGAEAHWHKHSEAAEKAMSKWLPAAKVVDILDE